MIPPRSLIENDADVAAKILFPASQSNVLCLAFSKIQLILAIFHFVCRSLCLTSFLGNKKADFRPQW